MTIVMRLKMLADVGLVGFLMQVSPLPLSPCQRPRPKIADYHLPWSQTSVGEVLRWSELCDGRYPSIIEGAAEGKGLEYCISSDILSAIRFCWLVIPSDAEDIAKEYDILLNELQRYNPEMMSKNRVLGISKAKLNRSRSAGITGAYLPEGYLRSSSLAVTGEGIKELKDMIWHYCQ